MKKIFILGAFAIVTLFAACNKNNDLQSDVNGLDGNNGSNVTGTIQIRIEAVDNDGSIDYSPVTAINL